MNRHNKTLRQKLLYQLINYYPPFLGAGVRVEHVDESYREIRVSMKLTWWNRNYMGTQFGGTLYAMTDPFYMLMMIENLGDQYVIWDKSAAIRFKRPGRGKVTAHIRIDSSHIESVQAEVDREGRAYPSITIQILAEDGSLVAEVDKTLSVRKKKTEAAS